MPKFTKEEIKNLEINANNKVFERNLISLKHEINEKYLYDVYFNNENSNKKSYNKKEIEDFLNKLNI